jgi:hypothetical protein
LLFEVAGNVYCKLTSGAGSALSRPVH